MREPDLVGAYGQAWRLKRPENNPSLVSYWLVNRPGAHPFWSWWIMSSISLADFPGIRPARKLYAEAEFEFMIYTIDPTSCPNPEPDEEHYPPLLPLDVVEQFHGIIEEDVARLTEMSVQSVVNGQISPDQDFRRIWKDVIAITVKHLREGKHPTS